MFEELFGVFLRHIFWHQLSRRHVLVWEHYGTHASCLATVSALRKMKVRARVKMGLRMLSEDEGVGEDEEGGESVGKG